jgi:hypothetical protein
MNQGQWMLDSRSLGIGIAIGILVTVILASFIGLLSVSLRRKPYRSSRSQTRTRTTLPLTFSLPANLTSSKNRHVPTATARLSLDSRRKAAVATPPPRSPSPDFVLDIAPRKAREASPPSREFIQHRAPGASVRIMANLEAAASSQVDPQGLSELDLEEMRATNTFSGLPTVADAERASTSRPASAHLSGAIFDVRSPTITPHHNPSSSAGSRRALTARHKRVSELELEEGTNSPWAQTAVRRVQSAGYLGDHAPRTEQQSQAQLYARKWEQEHAGEGSRAPRGMGHTLPKPQTAKTVPSRPGTGNGTGITERNTPFSSSSSLGLQFGTSSGTNPFDNFSPTTAGTGTGNASFTYPPSQITEKDYRRRRRREKDHETHSHGSTPEPSHSQGESITTLSPLDQDADIAPPPYNVANVHSSSHDHDADPSSHQLSDPDGHKRWHLQMQRERIRAQLEAQAQERIEEPNPEEEEQERVKNRSRSDSRSSEMGFGVSHHARNHLL